MRTGVGAVLKLQVLRPLRDKCSIRRVICRWRWKQVAVAVLLALQRPDKAYRLL
jgi:hypothetical protein